MLTSLQNPIFTPLVLSKPLPHHIPSFIVCVRRRSRKPFFTQKTTRLIVNTALTVASNFNILPPPLTALIREFGSGNGGGFGRGSGGGGGFGWWRRRGRSLGFVILVVVCGLGLCAGGKLSQNEVIWCCLGLALVGGVMSFWKGGIADWSLGFCSCAGIVSLGMRRKDEVRKWSNKTRAFALVLEDLMMRRSRSRKVF